MDSSGQNVELHLHCSSSHHSRRSVNAQTTGPFSDQPFSVSGSSYVIVDSQSLEANSAEKVVFLDVGEESSDNDGLVGIIETLKKHTKTVGTNVDGDNVAIGDFTADADNDKKPVIALREIAEEKITEEEGKVGVRIF